MKNRGGMKECGALADSLIARQRLFRLRDIKPRMNSTNWGWFFNISGLREVSKNVWAGHYDDSPPKWSVAVARVGDCVLGLWTSLWFFELLDVEPKFVDVVRPRGARRILKPDPPMRFFWATDAARKGAALRFEVRGQPVHVHTPARALVDIVRLDPGADPRRVREAAQRTLARDLMTPQALLRVGEQLQAGKRIAPLVAYLREQPRR